MIPRAVELGRRAAGGAEKRLRRIGDRLRTGGEPPRIGDALRDAYVTGWRDVPCAFVCSTGRVGTMSLTQLFALAPELYATHEPMPRLIHAGFEAYADGCSSPHWATVVLGARDDLLCDAHRRGKVYVETSNRLTLLAPALAAALPASRFVHLHRHPYLYVRSAVRRGHYAGHHWDFARPVPRADDPAHDRWAEYSPVAKSAWLWAAVNRESAALVGSLDADRALTVAAEHLFAGDPTVVAALFALVGAAVPPEKAVRALLSQPTNAQDTGDFDLDAAARHEVDAIAGPVASDLGYHLG